MQPSKEACTFVATSNPLDPLDDVQMQNHIASVVMRMQNGTEPPVGLRWRLKVTHFANFTPPLTSFTHELTATSMLSDF